MMLESRHWLLRTAALSLGAICLSSLAHAAAVATVEVDARDAPRGIQRVHLTMPVESGNLTLLYPKWLPGEHAPNGPIGAVSDLRFSSGGKALSWRRDDVNMYAFHVTVPANAASLEASFEVLSEHDAKAPNALRLATHSVAIILWNELMLYPAGVQSDDMQVTARLRLPSGWEFGTALPRAGGAAAGGDDIQFARASLTTLIDSPVLAGRYFRTEALGGTPAVYLHLAADSAAALAMPSDILGQYRKLVQEAGALFGATHYNEYHFLWSLSEQIDFEGIEHHQSSDNRSTERTLIDGDMRRSSDAETLLPHEYTHSWNGKYRRPAGLATGNYDSPMRGELLWVYEGLTEYIGMVLSARSGLASAADARDAWADAAAWAETRKGREWRPLADTAISGPIIYDTAPEWQDRTRGSDFYVESALLWLEADTLIRSKSRGAKSLDDFCKLFHGAPSTAPKVVSYDFNDVVKALNTVLPYDWRGFWTERLNRLRAAAPLEGLKAGGWHLSFDSEPTPEQKGVEAIEKKTNLQYSLGFDLRDDGAVITNILPGSPADLAGIAPGSRLIAVDGRKYSKEILQDTLNAAGTGAGARSIKFLIEKDDMFNIAELRYAGKARYPRLERDASVPDVLSTILAAHSSL
ncbi:MAG TPA: PDZ domain-containing protein [Steroidobacteraceae bacterium]|nr:PDZ domain-containing protein [Steroidobacteraceae bacterium]